ncbi:epoxide hydrolase [Chryseobacterium cucumeris]|uniref:epoxide hydrolase family protein n=1 Tax=Chryseobacterium cucumeris TaxID=1813611 RepID=UPI000787307C|nr:epoxide hydrolase [Chryseobacterium cucumeris]KYH07211.1 epoxide hydrolase [Chryseobacterium cucumeris]
MSQQIHSYFVLPEATEDITPFTVHIPETAIVDLKQRLEQIRWPDQELVNDWSQGVPLEASKKLIEYWKNEYDWRKFETRLNQFPQYRTLIDGVGIYFIHARSPHPDALPLLLSHGWPGSIIEFMDVIERLTDPTGFGGKVEDAFHVIIPAMPGFSFSDKPKELGWNPGRIASAYDKLMKEKLGYQKWVAQGGDFGSAVTHALADMQPEGLLAAHVNLLFVVPDEYPKNPTAEEQKAIDGIEDYLNNKSGYADIMNTRPQTIGYALNDSPLALATFIYEKFWEWTDNNGKPEDALSMDQMLDDISLYWFTGTGTSAARLYWEGVGSTIRTHHFFAASREASGVIKLPMGASLFPAETFTPPKKWAEKAWSDIFYWNHVEKGGHFAAFEEPEIFAEEMWKAFKGFRS